MGVGLRLPLGNAVRKHILVRVLATQLEVLGRGGGGERGRGGRGGLKVADKPVPLTHQAQLALGKVVREHVRAVWVRVCVGVVRVQVVFTDVIQIPQVGAGIAASLWRANSVEARVTAQLGEAGATVAGPDTLRPWTCAWGFE